MNIEQAKKVVLDYIDPDDGGFFPDDHYASWSPGEMKACLDGNFTADELQAFAVIMRAGT